MVEKLFTIDLGSWWAWTALRGLIGKQMVNLEDVLDNICISGL